MGRIAIAARAFAAGLLLLVAGRPALAAAGPVVEVTGGQIEGQARPGGGAVFLGLPFARPPVGDLRWRAPRPVEPWSGVRSATAEPPPCLQAFVGWNKADADAGREDCLYLDVATPKLDQDAKLPVLVWIHGGANWAGSGRGTVFSQMTRRGVVLVAIQYRLGVFGFLSHPALTAEQGGASGNYALMDQIAALTWVKANIARFGGDPGKVTIAGQSAGAQDVGLLQLSPLTRDLFARAIQESGTAGFGLPPRSLAQNEAIGTELATLAGAPDGAGALAALRAMPGETLLKAEMAMHGPKVLSNDSFLWLQATVDGRVIDETPAKALADGRAFRPLLLGSNAREIDFYADVDLPAAVRRSFGEAGVKALALYGGPDPRLGGVPLQVATDGMYRCASAFTAQAVEARGVPAFLYHFDLARSGEVSHSAELPYVFDDLPAAGASLQAYWTNFARSGDPNGEGLPAWPRFGAERAYLQVGPEATGARRDLRGPICRALGRP